MGRRGKSSRGRVEGRVRERVRERVQKRPGRGGDAGRKRGAFDVRALEGYAGRLSGRTGGSSGLAGAASGLAGAASGFAGGRLAHRLAGSDTEGSEEDFRAEVRERLDLVEGRLQRLEDEMYQLRGGEDPAGATEPGAGPEPQSDQDQ